MIRRSLLAAAALAVAACGPARIETDPPTVQLFGRGQKATIHAVGLASNGRAMANQVCAWSSSDDRVARVAGPHNVATVTAVGQGRAIARCRMGSASAEVPISVTVVSRVEVKPEQLELRLLDVAVPTALEVRALDGEGHEVQGRTVGTTCLDEGVCRGDSRGQVWPVGAGATRVLVRVEEGEAAVAVRVTDERSAAGRPRRVKGNPMEHIGDAPAAAGPRARRR